MTKKLDEVTKTLKAASRKLQLNEWITGSLARDENNQCVTAKDPRACKFCAVGAISAVASNPNIKKKALRKVRRVIRALPKPWVTTPYYSYYNNSYTKNEVTREVENFNDHEATSVEDILEVFDKAMKL